MKTYQDFIDALDSQLKKEVVANTKVQIKRNELPESYYEALVSFPIMNINPDKDSQAQAALKGLFKWRLSPEGFDYWAGVCELLDDDTLLNLN